MFPKLYSFTFKPQSFITAFILLQFYVTNTAKLSLIVICVYYFTVGIKSAKYQFSTQSKKLKRCIVIEDLESILTQNTQQNIQTAANI